MEAFLTHLAISGISGSTQNQAFNALLCFYRDVLKLELGPANSLIKAPNDLGRFLMLQPFKQGHVCMVKDSSLQTIAYPASIRAQIIVGC